MAKRFTDSDKWKKSWFRQLSPVQKCFWEYLRDTCDHAGVWEVDFESAAFHVGAKLDRDDLTAAFAKQFYPFAGGKRWLIVDFIEFQYGILKETNNAHASVVSILKKHGIWEICQTKAFYDKELAPAQPLPSPCPGALDMDKDQDKDLLKGDARGKQKFDHPWIQDPDFAPAWDGWVEMRIAKKKRPTEYAKKLAMKALQELCAGDMAKAIEIVNESTLRGWDGFFPLKEAKNGVNGKHPQKYESAAERNQRKLFANLGIGGSPGSHSTPAGIVLPELPS